MLKYTGLLIDLDDTILRSFERYAPALEYTSEIIAKRFNADAEELLEAVTKERKNLRLLMPNLPLGHNRLIAFRNALENIGAEYKITELADLEDLFWNKFLDGIELFEGATDALAKLKDAGVKIVIISDGDLSWRLKKVKKLGLEVLIDDIVASEEVVFEKPFGALFALALKRIGKKEDEVLMLGNNLINDVHGAQQAGIRAGLFDPEEGGNVYGREVADFVKPDFIVRNYEDLLKEFGL
jgi:putative hydrolase of the HAD superfamily